MSGHGLRRSVGFDGAYSPLGSDFERRGSVSDDMVDRGATTEQVGPLGCTASSGELLKWKTGSRAKVEVDTTNGQVAGYVRIEIKARWARLGKRAPEKGGTCYFVAPGDLDCLHKESATLVLYLFE